MNRLVLCSCLLLTAAVSFVEVGWAGTPSASNDDGKHQAEPAAHVSVRLPIRLYWGYVVIVQGSIGNVPNLNFLVDTGAYPSAVDEQIAHNLGLAEQPARVNLSNSSVKTRIAVLPSLRVGPLHTESLPVLTEDLSFYEKALGQKVDAIVGMDVLSKSSFAIDYRKKEILFGPTKSLGFVVPFDTEVPVVTVQMTVHTQRLRLVVDTGTPDLMLLKNQIPGFIGFQNLGTETVSDASGTFLRAKVRIPDVYLGKANIGSQIAFVTDDRKDDGDNFDGVLGMRGPQFRKIAFDFEHLRFSWER
jgi:predicted aspartyl protease